MKLLLLRRGKRVVNCASGKSGRHGRSMREILSFPEGTAEARATEGRVKRGDNRIEKVKYKKEKVPVKPCAMNPRVIYLDFRSKLFRRLVRGPGCAGRDIAKNM